VANKVEVEMNAQNRFGKLPYYAHIRKMPLTSKVSFHVRSKMFTLFMAAIRPGTDSSILDLGVTSDDR
jgi:hypothetical protein